MRLHATPRSLGFDRKPASQASGFCGTGAGDVTRERMNQSIVNLEAKAVPAGIPWAAWFQTAALVLVIGILYRAILAGLVFDWWNDPNWSHGFFVPAFSGWLVWQRRARLAALPRRPSWSGAMIIAGGLGVLVVGVLGAEYFLSRSSFLILLAGLVICFFGWEHFGRVAFPWAFLFFMIPIPAIVFNRITFPLQLHASWLASGVLPLMGIPVFREGNIIQLPEMSLEVAQACSGIRSLMSLGMLAVICAYFFERRTFRRALLVMAAVPIAIFVNGLRIVGTGVLVHYWSPERAEGFFHTFEGWLTFGLSLIMLFAVHALMRLLDKRRWVRQV